MEKKLKAKIRPNYILALILKENKIQYTFDNDDVLIFEKRETDKFGLIYFYFSVENIPKFNNGKTFIRLEPGDFYWYEENI